MIEWTMPTAELLERLHWDSDTRLSVDGTMFRLLCDPAELHAEQSAPDDFVLGKVRPMVEASALLGRAGRVRNVFEMGIFKGGSVALNELLYSPDKLVAVDIATAREPALDRFLAARGRAHAVKLFYGVDQRDAAAMGRVLAAEFPGQDLDLVVDDASHMYEQTRAAFNLTFPYLRHGGSYVLEDWGWAHWPGAFWQKDNPYFGDKRALSNLVAELLVLSASRPDLVEKVVVEPATVTVTRGSGQLPPAGFELGEHMLMRGKRWTAPL